MMFTKTTRRAWLAIGTCLVLSVILPVAPARSAAGCGNAAIPSVDGPYPVTRESASVTTRDGESLATWVFKPTATPPAGGWPLIVQLHGGAAMANDPRNDVAPMESQNAYACRGYIVVSYMRRGYPGIITTNPSPAVNPSSNRATTTGWDWGGPIDVGDGKDVISWAIANQPVNANRIGVTGGSQGSFVAYALAGNDSRIRTIIPTAGYDNWNEHASRNGVMTPGCPAYAAFMAGLLTTATVENGVEYCKLTLGGAAGLGRDNAYWWERSPARWAPQITIPVFNAIHTLDPNWNASGWIRMHELLPGAHNKLFVGPVPIHINVPLAARVRFQTDVQRWWDQWLKDADTGIMAEPPVTWAAPPRDFFSATEPWTFGRSQSLPPCAAAPVSLSLSGGNRLVSGAGSGPADVLLNNPATGAVNLAATGMAVVETPADTAVFRSDAFTADTVLTGDISLDLALTSLSPRYQVHPDLYDVAPDGTAEHIYYSSANVGPIIPFGVFDGVPGQPKRLRWDPLTTFYVFEAGHRLELRISAMPRGSWMPEPTPGGFLLNHAGATQSTLELRALPRAQLGWSNDGCPA
jgi:predicted acyl esterase